MRGSKTIGEEKKKIVNLVCVLVPLIGERWLLRFLSYEQTGIISCCRRHRATLIVSVRETRSLSIYRNTHHHFGSGEFFFPLLWGIHKFLHVTAVSLRVIIGIFFFFFG